MRWVFLFAMFLSGGFVFESSYASAADPYAQMDHGKGFSSVKDFGAVGDGIEDDTAAIQAAINSGCGSEYHKRAPIVYVPAGTYRITNTIILWGATTLTGDSSNPPIFLLPENTPGFTDPVKTKPLIATTPGYDQAPGSPNWTVQPEKHGSINNNFAVSIRFIKLKMEKGNPGAIGIFWQVAQCSSLRDVEIDSVDAGIGIYTDGVCYDIKITGGKVGVYFNYPGGTGTGFNISGQSEAAMVLDHWWVVQFVDIHIENVPVGIKVVNGYGVSIFDSSFKNIKGYAIGGSRMDIGASEVSLENVNIENVGKVVGGKWSPENGVPKIVGWSSGKAWIDGKESSGPVIQEKLTRPPMCLRKCPRMQNPVSVYKYGAKGDRKTDDTAALQKAISENKEVFLPHGDYLVSDTINLRADTQLFTETHNTRIVLKSNSPGFNDPSNPKAMLETPDAPDGTANIVGLNLSGEVGNPGAIFLDWRLGQNSGVWDVSPYFYGNGDNCLYAIQLRGSGGGIFCNISATGVTKYLFRASSKGPFWGYGMDYEHSSKECIILEDCANYVMLWPLYEQNNANSATALGVDKVPTAMLMKNCSNMSIYGAALAGYWIQSPEQTIKMIDCKDIRVVQFMTFNSPAFVKVERKGQEPELLLTVPKNKWKPKLSAFQPNFILSK